MLLGKDAELDFKARMLALNRVVTNSTKDQDRHDHIDFFVDGITYDVKSEKRFRRRDDNTRSDLIWLEMKNVRGHKGWLCSEVNKIAFELDKQFYIFDREKLLQFAREFLIREKIYNVPYYRKLYRRSGTSDLISYVYLNDIIHLVEEII
jgi:hypothetical protein